MTTDPYMDAINAGAAALAKPYRDPDTISAFVETFPTIAAARVIDAALPWLRTTIIAETIPPGPCPEVSEFGHAGPYADGINPEPRTLRALCDLRAGHAGQHEAYDDDWGTYRWTRTDTTPQVQAYTELWPELANRCAVEHPKLEMRGVVCWKSPGHADAHDNGAHMWNDCGDEVQRGV